VRVNRHHRPLSIVSGRKILHIEKVHEVWEVDMEWWRPQRTFRRYYRVATRDKVEMTIFWDLTEDRWYRQQG
jgi:hypothetical protein